MPGDRVVLGGSVRCLVTIDDVDVVGSFDRIRNSFLTVYFSAGRKCERERARVGES